MYGSDTVFEGKLHMNEVQVANDLAMGDGAKFKEVILRGAKIGGQLGMSGSGTGFESKLDMNRVQANGLLMGDGAKFKEVDLGGANIGGNWI